MNLNLFLDPPPSAAWEHRDSRRGFEVSFFEPRPDGLMVRGQTAAVEEGEIWAVGYEIRLDRDWRTREATVTATSATGARETTLVRADAGWFVGDVRRPDLDGCEDVDLESSSLTNAFPVHRLRLGVGERAEAPAVWVRALDFSVERLEQTYERLDDAGDNQRFDYLSPRDDFRAEIVYDRFGLAVDYPGIAVRSA